jgi:tRNA(fMet)-specific endonuclease VapC
MSRIVVDTDVASYIFNWHSLAQQYADALRGSELVLSFMTVAEMRMGAISAGWGSRRRVLLEQFVQRFELVYADNDLCTVWARIRADARTAGRRLSPQDAWIAATALALDAPLATNNRRDRSVSSAGFTHCFFSGRHFLMPFSSRDIVWRKRVGNSNHGRPSRNPLSTTATCQQEKSANWTETDGPPTRTPKGLRCTLAIAFSNWRRLGC